MRAALLVGLSLWLLVRPLELPGVWAWQVVGAYETWAECEAARAPLLSPSWLLCAEATRP